MANLTTYSMKNYPAFSPQMKMADLIHVNYRNLAVLSRLGISLGFGEKTVDEVCKRHNVDVNLLLLICNVLLDTDMIPAEEQIAKCPVEQVIRYLQQSHQYYLNVALPNIQILLDRLVEACNETHGKALNRFFNEYRKEVESHLAHEDQTVFPYIMQLLNAPKKSKFSIRQYKDRHANIEVKLTDLKNIIIKYIPYDNTDNLRDELLIQLFNFEDDLNRHTLIEEKLLVPSVILIEQNISLS
ncbi:hemerythrin domain-containing protein [Paludibacter sp.]|uniref:hemerythrin domain-containing protein n=1 Tax=Paludibacter sp. TaxID=1898105 RepID=UPI001352E8D0|nr:hemerythrin domain-containing protein [Paludibacter sp.]MTK54079.1 hemerythrin domain-containing protein [Paludibacter sp.]